ncbi:SET and MYND domain-containing protein 4-like isoform X2 [Leptopilina boulardi]|uniref:SET and MYND domain-containing protein 4-like isoform X2 n=1 Tax=Leptopilina boulardi TaxID=63433 RepID=UPI0021F50BD0|nr:SET and MYND domain-containing protein 4-like isoform X2 [Leptopilina boulardi]
MELVKTLIFNLIQNNSQAGYGLQKESEALISYVLQNMSKSALPDVEPEIKNEKNSLHYRNEGNQHFIAGNDLEAIESFTKSLAYADSEELMGYAHANRSAALYRKKFYKNCLIDIDAALSHGYPEEKREKLKERGRKALGNLMNSSGNFESFDPFENNNESNNKIKKKFPLIQNVIQDLEEPKDNEIREDFLLPGTSKTQSQFLINDNKENLILTHGPSEETPVVSNGVNVRYSEKYGRHMVATQYFEPGDIISVEDPFAYVIYQDKYYTHCFHCLTRSYNLIPCSKCPIAQYCSEKCKQLDWKLAHCTECYILTLLSNLLNIDRDKIRMLSKIVRFLIIATSNGTGIDKLREDLKIAESNTDRRTSGFTENDIFDSTSAKSALSLATNMSARLPIGISAFACLSALATMLLATKTKFFGNKYQMDELKKISKLPDITFCGSIMFRASVIMSSNSFSIQQTPGVKVGSGLYIVHSLYNHSCAPNTLRHFEGLTMITRALETISPGDQIFTSYGGGHQHIALIERRKKMMDDYFFNCDCPACISDWPTYREILQNHVGSISKNKELVEKLLPFKKRLLKNKYDIDAAKCILKILYKEAKMPCEEIVHGMQYLKSYYLGYLNKYSCWSYKTR